MSQDNIEKVISEIRNKISEFNWNMIGFIDKERKVYPMTYDTKVLSKVFEVAAIPHIEGIAKNLSEDGDCCELLLAKEQNQYPDLILSGGLLGDQKIAIDIKSGYRTGNGKFSGFTLGAFNGYFKNRMSTKNIMYPYDSFVRHLILCFIYDRDTSLDYSKTYSIEQDIPNAITNVEVILQDKWKVAGTSPGSGNTANIGSVKSIDELINGTGPFSTKGKDVFDDYWMHYIRKEDCGKIGIEERPYTNMKEYEDWIENGRKGNDDIERHYEIGKDDLSSFIS